VNPDRQVGHGTHLHVYVAAAALNFPQIRDELQTAQRHVDGLLNILPIDDKEAGIDSDTSIEQGGLAPELVAPQAVRVELFGICGKSKLA